jgi:hypothetical protein
MLPAAARGPPLGRPAAPCRSPRGSGAAATATLAGVVMLLSRRRRGEDEVWMVVVVVVVIAETAGASEACRTLPGPSLVLATFLLFDLGSGTSFSSYSFVEGLRLPSSLPERLPRIRVGDAFLTPGFSPLSVRQCRMLARVVRGCRRGRSLPPPSLLPPTPEINRKVYYWPQVCVMGTPPLRQLHGKPLLVLNAARQCATDAY